jgi:hypothetical protein
MLPYVVSNCNYASWKSPGVAQSLSRLAPRLAPRDLVAFVDVRASEVSIDQVHVGSGRFTSQCQTRLAILPRMPGPLVSGVRVGEPPASSTAPKPRTVSCHLRQYRWWVMPLGLGTTSRWNRSSSSSGDSQSRDPDPSSTCETVTCIVSTRSALRNYRMVVAHPSRTSLPCAASRARSNTDAGSASTKWNVVSPRVNEGRVWWVSTITGVWNGGSPPHQPRQSWSYQGPRCGRRQSAPGIAQGMGERVPASPPRPGPKMVGFARRRRLTGAS